MIAPLIPMENPRITSANGYDALQGKGPDRFNQTAMHRYFKIDGAAWSLRSLNAPRDESKLVKKLNDLVLVSAMDMLPARDGSEISG